MFGVSFDTEADNAAFARKYDLPYPLLCDTKREMGLAFKACEAQVDPYPNRITYVIGPDGTIEQAIETEDVDAQAGEIASSLS